MRAGSERKPEALGSVASRHSPNTKGKRRLRGGKRESLWLRLGVAIMSATPRSQGLPMPNLSLEEIEDGFVLRDGLVEIKMTTEELLSLRATMNLALDRKLTTFRTRSGQVHPAWVH